MSQSTAMVITGGLVHLTTLFSWASLNKCLTSTACTYFCSQQPFLNDSFSGREENDRGNKTNSTNLYVEFISLDEGLFERNM